MMHAKLRLVVKHNSPEIFVSIQTFKFAWDTNVFNSHIIKEYVHINSCLYTNISNFQIQIQIQNCFICTVHKHTCSRIRSLKPIKGLFDSTHI